jgi:hypothetical protein
MLHAPNGMELFFGFPGRYRRNVPWNWHAAGPKVDWKRIVTREYMEQRNGGYYVAGTRVSLDSVVYGFLRGESPVVLDYSLANARRTMAGSFAITVR